MADVVWLEFAAGLDAAAYDAVNARVNPPGNPPAGLIFHSAGPSPDGGWRIIDVWDSRAAFDRFLAEQVGPTMGEMFGDAAGEPPKITSWPAHNYVIA
jgi:hypothetical protein